MTPDSEHLYRSAPTPAEIHPVETVMDPELRATLAYWNRVRGTRAMPTRADISPKELRRSLRHIHMYDVMEGGRDFRARLVGTGVFPGLDEDQTGKLVSAHPDPGIRLRFGALLSHVAATGMPARSLSVRVTGSLLMDARTEGLWLPLGEGRTVQQILVHSSLTPIQPG